MDSITLDYIKTATAVATFLLSESLQTTVENVRSYFRQNPNALSQQFEKPAEITFVNLLVIDPGLLDDLNEDVDKTISGHRQCLKDASTSTERDACDKKAERGVCESLNRIKDKNEEDLPTDILNDRWKSYRCIRY